MKFSELKSAGVIFSVPVLVNELTVIKLVQPSGELWRLKKVCFANMEEVSILVETGDYGGYVENLKISGLDFNQVEGGVGSFDISTMNILNSEISLRCKADGNAPNSSVSLFGEIYV